MKYSEIKYGEYFKKGDIVVYYDLGYSTIHLCGQNIEITCVDGKITISNYFTRGNGVYQDWTEFACRKVDR